MKANGPRKQKAVMVWLNGGLCPAEKACITPNDRGFLLADGVFETLRVVQGAPCDLLAHLHRLNEGAGVLGMPEPKGVAYALQTTLAANRIDYGSARITWTRGAGPRGLLPSGHEVPTLLITTVEHAPSNAPIPPWALITCLCTRRNEHSPLSRIKSLNYGDGLLARQEAAARQANDAILLNSADRVAETSIATLFVRREGVWITPPVSEGALPGIRRAHALAEGLATEGCLTRADLAQAEAAVLTSALMVQPVGSIDGRPLPEMAQALMWAENLTSTDRL